MVRLWPILVVAMLAITAAPGARAADERISLGEIAVTGLDEATVKSTAERELGGVDTKRIKRRVVVSVAARASDAPTACTVSTIVRDRKSGNIIAVVEGRASTDAGGSEETRNAVLRVAMRTAVRQIPDAVNGITGH